MRDIGSDESEDLARIIAPLVSDAVSASLGSTSASSHANDRGLKEAAVAAASPQLAKLQVRSLSLPATCILC